MSLKGDWSQHQYFSPLQLQTNSTLLQREADSTTQDHMLRAEFTVQFNDH